MPRDSGSHGTARASKLAHIYAALVYTCGLSEKKRTSFAKRILSEIISGIDKHSVAYLLRFT